MQKNWIIGGLIGLLFLSFAAFAYLFVTSVSDSYYSASQIQTRARYMNAYDQLVCDLICGKTIEEANILLSPHEVVRFKTRQDLAHLYIDRSRIQICLEGDIIRAVESSPYVDEKPYCLNTIDLFDGTSSSPADE